MGADNRNNRQTGARKFEAHPEEVDRDRVGLKAAENRRSGLMRNVDETIDKTLQSDAVDQRPMQDRKPERRGRSEPKGR
jgi:hypothetical protein